MSILDDWVRRDAPRLDADDDGLYDEPGPAIMDAAWRPIAEAVMRPVFGAACSTTSNDVRSLGGLSGESYVDKDLRTLLGERVRGQVQPPLLRRRLARRLPGVAVGGGRHDRGRPGGRARAPTRRQWLKEATRTTASRRGCCRTRSATTNRPTFQQVLEFQSR